MTETSHSQSKDRISGDFAAFATPGIEQPAFNGLSEFLKYFRENVKCNGPFAYQGQTLRMLDLRPGQSVLEIGPGRGDDLTIFGKLVSNSGSIAGIELSTEFAETTKHTLMTNGLAGDIRVGDVSKGVPFPDASFDRVYIERVLQYLPNPGEVLKECYRTLRPDGRVVVFDSDWDTATILHPDRKLTREILHLVTDKLFASGQIGRHLKSLAIKAGFTVLEERAHAISHTPESAEYVLINPIKSLVTRQFLPQETLDRWLAGLATIPKEQQSFSLNGVLMSARRAG